MNNKLRHAICIFFDLFCVVMLWILYKNFDQTLMEIHNQADIIRFGNRDGFFIVGMGFPVMHLLVIIEQLWPNFINKLEKYKKPINYCVMGFIFGLLVAGFALSSWLQSRAEKAGYVYCWYVSGSSALAKTLVYTKDVKICKDLEAEARAERKR